MSISRRGFLKLGTALASISSAACVLAKSLSVRDVEEMEAKQAEKIIYGNQSDVIVHGKIDKPPRRRVEDVDNPSRNTFSETIRVTDEDTGEDLTSCCRYVNEATGEIVLYDDYDVVGFDYKDGIERVKIKLHSHHSTMEIRNVRIDR